MKDFFRSLSERQKLTVMMAYDLCLLTLLCLLFYPDTTRLPVYFGMQETTLLLWRSLIFPCVTVFCIYLSGFYQESIRLLSRSSYQRLGLVTLFTCLLSGLVIDLIGFHSPGFRDFVLFWLLSFFALSLSRFGASLVLSDRSLKGLGRELLVPQIKTHRKKIALAFDSTTSLQEIHTLTANTEFQVVTCIDIDNGNHRGLLGIPVTGLLQWKASCSKGVIDCVFLMDMKTPEKLLFVEKQLATAGFRTVRYRKSLEMLIAGNDEVGINDILGRMPVPPKTELMSSLILGKNVLVTGAGGSIGSELCLQVLKQRPNTLILYDHAEFNLYKIEQQAHAELKGREASVHVEAVLGSVTNAGQLQELMQGRQIHTVYHAAAYKHVPIIEKNMIEGVSNNVLGTLHTSLAAVATGVENFVLVSTDKAVRPTNVMGASKRMCEMICQALAAYTTPFEYMKPETCGFTEPVKKTSKTRFTMVRFGNVLGSSGSVIPAFLQQIAHHGPVTVTHPEITRYFMSIPEAAELVIQAGAMGGKGEVFVLDMGEPVRIDDLARRLIACKGYKVRSEAHPEGIEITYTGLRPGEKLYEELLIGDDVIRSRHPKIFKSKEEMLAWPTLSAELMALGQALKVRDTHRTEAILQDHVIGFVRTGISPGKRKVIGLT